jgi:hypothetical protein
MQKNSVRLQVVNVDTAEEVLVRNSSFLLRFWIEDATVERCLIRHLSSGRQVYVQSGNSLKGFIQECLLEVDSPLPGAAE